MKRNVPVGAIFFVCVLSIGARAQTNPNLQEGLSPFDALHGGNIDRISLSTGNLYAHIPLLSYPQRGKLRLSFSLQSNNKGWYVRDNWLIYPYHFWTPNLLSALRIVDDDAWTSTLQVSQDKCGQRSLLGAWVNPPDDSSHVAGYISGSWNLTCGATQNFVMETGDGTAVQLQVQSRQSLLGRDGIRYGNFTSREDPNGNKIGYNSIQTGTDAYGVPLYANYYVDTLGRNIPDPNGGTQNIATSDYTGCQGPLPVSSAVLWSPPGPNGGTVPFKFCYAAVSLQTNFGLSGTQEYSSGSQPAVFLQSIVLPDGTAWTFEYNDRSPGDPSYVNYGSLTKITFPTGGSVSYAYANVALGAQPSCGTGGGPALSRTVVSRTVDANDGTGPHTWTYQWGSINTASLPYTMTNVMSDPSGNDTVFLNSNLDTWRETQRQIFQGSRTTGTLLETAATDWSTLNCGHTPQSAPSVVPVRITTIWPNGKTSKTERDSDSALLFTNGYKATYGDVLAGREYDYGNGAPGPLLRQTLTNFLALSNSSYLNNNILDLVSSITVNDGAGVQRAYTSFGYDESPLTPSGVTTQLDSNPPTGLYRGNQTSEHRWVNTTGGYLTTSETYFDTGMVNTAIDPAMNTTTFSYSSTFAGAYVTQTQFPDTYSPNLAHHIISGNYDFNTGLITSFTDQNGKMTTYSYDNILRLNNVNFPDGGATNFYYPDPVTVERRQKIDATRNTDRFIRFDGLGRESRRIMANGESTPWDQVDTCYGPLGRKSFVSYPYQGAGLSSAQVCSGAGDAFAYDALGRQTAIRHSDGTNMNVSYAGAARLVSDEGNGAGSVQRVSQYDALGRLISVCEVTNTAQVGAGGTPGPCGQDIAATGFLTTYSYDALGNPLSVSQVGLNPRAFRYDSLSRLTQASNPESGTITYSYTTAAGGLCSGDPGSVCQRTDARGIKTTYAYDALDRLVAKTYSDGTPGVAVNYDEDSARGVALTNTKGARSSESTAGGFPTGEVFSYDSMGRPVNNSQCTPQNCGTLVFSLTYQYDLTGDLTSTTNGLGTALTYAFNVAARLTGVTSSLFDASHPAAILSGVHYNAFGLHTTAALGNSLSESLLYTPRGWLQSLTVGPSTSPSYGLSITTYAGDGDVLTANDSVNGSWTYGYDYANRLSSASKPGQAFTYSYDRFGNRWQQNGPNMSSLGFDANNHITAGSGFTYDAAGNATSDGVHTYTYDAENRVITVDGGATATYVYNAEGQRVRKTSSSGTVDYLYDLGGHIVTEVSATGAWNRGDVFAGGRHLATYARGSTYFIHVDWLGTERARTGVSGGSPVETCTSLPFGDWMSCTGTDVSPLHFTGKQRDVESGLDDFGARYYNSLQGRWLTPDWSARQDPIPYADVSNPQTLNLYAYVLNNPTTHLDPDGHKGDRCDASPCDGAWQFNSVNNQWLVGGRIWSPNGGTPPVTVKENVIYDTEANNGQGLTDKQKKRFADMQKETEQLYAQVNINFSVTWGEGSIVYTAGGNVLDVSGAVKGALNVLVTDRLGLAITGAFGSGAGASGILKASGSAINFIGLSEASHWTLSHEFAHHFLGHTKKPPGLFGNIARDIYINRFVLPHIQSYAGVLRQGALDFAGQPVP